MRLRRGEEGVTLVEAALVLPVLFLLTFGLVEVGLWVFDSTRASAAARDGARAAVLDYLRADTPGTADSTIVNAAAARHVGVPAPTVGIRCLHPDGTAVLCASAVPGEDRIEVSVSWERRTLTFVGDVFGDRARRVSATSAMAISGRPITRP